MTSPSEHGTRGDEVLRRLALTRYADTLESLSAPAPLDGVPFPYDTCPRIEEVRWRLSMVDQLLRDELRELANSLNEWRGALRRWHVWMSVMDTFSEEEAWSLQWEFVESIAFHCMFYPSAMRDRFTFVGTTALHQLRMAADDMYPDRLDADPAPGNYAPRFLQRRQKEAQFERISVPLPDGAGLVAALRVLDDDEYRTLTSNFRNLSSHALAPRLHVGYTNTVVRYVGDRKELVQQENGSFKDEVVPGKQAVYYGFGGTPPLPMREVFAANLQQFERAQACFRSYVNVLDMALATLPSRQQRG